MYNPSRSISVLIRLGFFFFLSSCDFPGFVDSWWFCCLETPILGFGGTGYLHGLSSWYHFIFSAVLTVWFYWVYLVLMRVQGSPELPGRNCPRLVRVWTLLPLERTSWGERPLTGHPATYAYFWPVEPEVSAGQGFLRQIPGELPSFLAFQWDKRSSSHREGVPSPGLTLLWRLCLLSSRGGTV